MLPVHRRFTDTILLTYICTALTRRAACPHVRLRHQDDRRYHLLIARCFPGHLCCCFGQHVARHEPRYALPGPARTP